MNRFSLKIYAVLLIMGAAPLFASAFLLSEVLTFNNDLQTEAVDTLNDVSHFHRAWARSEASRVRLLGDLLAQSPQLRAVSKTPSAPQLEAAQRKMDQAVKDDEILIRAELIVDEQVLAVAQTPHPPPNNELKTKVRAWEVESDQEETRGAVAVKLTFGIDKTLAERYEALGQRRSLHRALAAVEDESEGSLSEVYTQVYFIILALVVVLTVGFSMLITTPLSRRVSSLAAGTERVARGDLTVKLPVKGKDELTKLTEQFNQMVTDLREARRSHAYVERMRAWQEVARRLAHEIKNPLTPLLLAIQQLDKTFDNYIDHPERYRAIVSEVVEIVTEEVDTLRTLVKEFSEFARLPSANPTPRDLWDFVEHTLRSNPQFQDQANIVEMGGPAVQAKLDPALMRRVLVNVVRNGIEAQQEAGQEEIEVALSLEIHEKKDIARVVVRDRGPGLSAEQEERVFTPYFTTKESGTGLGLAIVRKIMMDHGGDIRLQNRPDGERGAEVWLDLPIYHPSIQGKK